MTLLVSVYMFALGLILGSFYNVVGLRLAVKEPLHYPPSHCMHCQHRLTPLDLIPVISYLFLRGRCRYCRTSISWLYPVIECVTACLFVFAYDTSSNLSQLIISLILISMLIILSVSDSHYYLVPDRLLVCFAVVWLVLNVILSFRPWLDGLLGAVIAFVLLYLLAVASRGGMGGGDIKLLTLLGFVLGVKGILLSMCLASLLGVIVMGTVYISRGWPRKRRLPFVPFIMLGVLLTFFVGDGIWQWYLSFW